MERMHALVDNLRLEIVYKDAKIYAPERFLEKTNDWFNLERELIDTARNLKRKPDEREGKATAKKRKKSIKD
jgi:hypothetical protein